MILRCCLFLLVFFTSVATNAAEANQPGAQMRAVTEHAHAKKLTVVATIRPVHSLLSFIMQGTDKPILLLDQTSSVHHYSLRPSQRRTLAHADILFWIGEPLESFMPRVINSLPRKVQTIELIETKGLALLEPRSAKTEAEGDAHKHDQHSHDSLHGAHHDEHVDPHIWLSIDNALTMATQMAKTLSQSNPALKALYFTNLKKLAERLSNEKKRLLKSFHQSDFNFLVYHDAFQYFETQINIKPLIAISTDEERTPSIKQLRKVNKVIANNSINCLIYNTSTLPSITRSLQKNNMSKIYIDPLGQSFTPGADLYFNLLESLASRYQQCQQKTE